MSIARGLRIFIIMISSLIGLTLLFAAFIVGAALHYNEAPLEPPLARGNFVGATLEEDGTVLFEVREGESAISVGRRLEQAGLIKNRLFWDIYSRFQKDFLKAGTYRLVVPATQTELRAVLVEGRQVLLRVTIPEGVTLRKAAAIIGQSGICSEEDFLAAAVDPLLITSYQIPGTSMEGYLFPDTYFFPGSFPADRVVRTMADTFFERIAEIAPESRQMNPQEINDIVILASIVEREYRVADEAPVMAGVFSNRMRINMNLESCATVQYIITEIQGKPHPHILLYADIAIQDPYNTYINRGLPPGPISFPGMTALRASFFPEQTEYLFFRLLNEAEGRHTFSRTFDAHLRAAALFVKS